MLYSRTLLFVHSKYSSLHLLITKPLDFYAIEKHCVKRIVREHLGFPGGASGRSHLPLQEMSETWVRPLGQEDLMGEGTATHSSILAWRIYGQRSLAGYSPWGCKDSDTTEHTHTPELYHVTSSPCSRDAICALKTWVLGHGF